MMSLQNVGLIVLFSVAAFILVAVISWFQPGFRPTLVKRSGLLASILAIPVALISTVVVLSNGVFEYSLFQIGELDLLIRLDELSVLMLTMISIIGFVVVKYSLNYLDGDQSQGAFLGRMSATLAAVQLIVLAGSMSLLVISWVLTSVCLHRLLIFYSDRRGAIVAARKKFIMARLSDISLILAAIFLYREFQTDHLGEIFSGLSTANDATLANVNIAAVLLVVSALLKSAQFPSHGWLMEVMETPTPVSALLHAGLLNAGPFLIIRMASVVHYNGSAQILLLAVGGFTALFGSVVYMTQSSVKTALSYSSAAHMGFSLFICGLGAYPAALLHVVAHSFYKAHSFLSSGSLIDQLRGYKVQKVIRKWNPISMIMAVVAACFIFTAHMFLFDVSFKEDTGLMLLGAIITMGISWILIQSFDSDGSNAYKLRSLVFAFAIVLSFFVLESSFNLFLGMQHPAMNTSVLMVAIFFIGVFALTILAQVFSFGKSPFWISSVYVHLKNGLYVNILSDRMVGTWKMTLKRRLTFSLRESIESGRVRKLLFEAQERRRTA